MKWKSSSLNTFSKLQIRIETTNRINCDYSIIEIIVNKLYYHYYYYNKLLIIVNWSIETLKMPFAEEKKKPLAEQQKLYTSRSQVA